MDFLAFWNGVKGHLGGGGRLRDAAGFEAAAIRGSRTGVVAQCNGKRRVEESSRRALCPPRRGCAQTGGGRGTRGGGGALGAAPGGGGRGLQCVERPAAGSSGRRRWQWRWQWRWRWQQRSAAGGRRRRCPGRAHTRAHTHTYTRPRTHSLTLRRAHAARRPEGGGSARLGGSVLGGRAAPAPRLRGSVQPARPPPSDPPPGVARPHALQRRRSSTRPREALRSPEGAGDKGTMYRDPDAAGPGKRGPARAGAPRTGGQDGDSAGRRLGAPAQGCCPPEPH